MLGVGGKWALVFMFRFSLIKLLCNGFFLCLKQYLDSYLLFPCYLGKIMSASFGF